MPPPSSSRLASWIAAAVVALCLLLQLPLYDRSVVPVDEGQLVAVADRLLHGEVLYRDIYTGIFPGTYYATAGLLAAFGEDVVVTRWAQLAVNAGTALLLFLLALRATRPGWALVPPLLYTALIAWSFPSLTMLNYSPLALLFGLGAVWSALRYLDSGRRGEGVATGLLLALCVLTKQNFGVLVGSALLVGFVWGRPGSALAAVPLSRALWPTVASAAALGLAAGGGLLMSGALPAFLRATVLTIGQSQLGAFNDPLPPILGAHPTDDGRFVFLYTPSALFNYLVRGEALLGQAITPFVRSAAIRLAYGGALAALVAAPLLLWLTRSGEDTRKRAAARVLAVLAPVFFLGIFPSAIWSHLTFVMAPVLLALGLAADRFDGLLVRHAPRAVWGWRGGFAAFVLVTLVVGVQIALDVRRWYPASLESPRASLYVSPDQADLLRGAMRFVDACAAAEDAIFVAPDMPLVYFLADRRNPTPFDLTIPGNVQGRVIIERLEADRTRCVVYNPTMYLQFEPFEELFPLLSRYLTASYRREVEIRGGDTVWHGLVRLD